MIFEQNDTFVDASRSGSYLEFEFWYRGRHRGFVRLPADGFHAAVAERREIVEDGLRVQPDGENGGWLLEYASRNALARIVLSSEEAQIAFFQEPDPESP